MPGYQQIVGGEPGQFMTAGQQMGGLGDHTGQVRGRHREIVEPRLSAASWHGASRDAAKGAADRIGAHLDGLVRALESVAPPLANVGRTGEVGKENMVALTDEARALLYEVLPVGMVVLSQAQLDLIAAAGPGAPELAAEYQLQAIMFTEDLWSMMTWVSTADVAAAERLMALSAEYGGPGVLPLSPHLGTHVFAGEWNNAGTRPVGYHYRPGGSDAGNPHGFSVVPGTQSGPDVNGVYKARFAGTNAAGTTVQKNSSYFPDSWSDEDVRRAIAGAFHSRHPVYEWRPPTTANPAGRLEAAEGMWEGSYNGMTIRGYMLSPGQPGYRGLGVGDGELPDVATAFPVRVGDAAYGQK